MQEKVGRVTRCGMSMYARQEEKQDKTQTLIRSMNQAEQGGRTGRKHASPGLAPSDQGANNIAMPLLPLSVQVVAKCILKFVKLGTFLSRIYTFV